MMVSIVAVSFTLLSAAFMLLSYRYILSEKRQALERNAEDIASLTSRYISSAWGGDIQGEAFRNSLYLIVRSSDSYVVLSDTEGSMIYACDGDTYYSVDKRVPDSVTRQVLEQGKFTGMSDLGGLFDKNNYVVGVPFVLTRGTISVIQGMVLVSTDTAAVQSMWQDTVTIFFFVAVIVLMIAVVASSLFASYQSRPLNEMAEAARKFGQGEFDTRVTGYENRGDEIGALAEAFNSMANSLEKVESQRADFIANVSHELKTPMTTIAGFAEGILDSPIPQEREKESLQIIVSETRRLSRLVRRMLDLSRLNALAESSITAQEQFDLTEVMSRVIVSLEGKITGRKLDVDVQMPDEKLMVWGDPDSITQVCYNLLDNAIKFSREGGTLGISVTAKGTKANITISNEGDTIPPEETSLIFDRFHKTDHSRSVDRDGVGLGLYIVKTILNSHKENITCTSEDGVTKFTFTLTRA